MDNINILLIKICSSTYNAGRLKDDTSNSKSGHARLIITVALLLRNRLMQSNTFI